MNAHNIKEVLTFLAAAIFFCIGMIVLNPQYIPISSSWDYIVLQLLTFMNGLGLCLVLGLLVNALFFNRGLRNELHDESSGKVPL
jgi:hypothetical protein